MSKYIEADRLKEKLDEHYRKYQSKYMETRTPYTQGLIDALDLAEQVIDSLQQEQPDFPTTDEEIEMFLATHLKVEVPDKYKTLDWLWKKEQLEVDLEEEINKFLESEKSTTYENTGTYKVAIKDPKKIARHFYKLGQREMRHRIMNPEYNAKVVEQLKSEYPAIKEE